MQFTIASLQAFILAGVMWQLALGAFLVKDGLVEPWEPIAGRLTNLYWIMTSHQRLESRRWQ
ncbi:hypothetical protein C8J57DRAFT_1522341 [Mycena rebaudengoi]|nr:hypothetical protein C8J57DRAFT_1522341 [Mycena rebaudengoi]